MKKLILILILIVGWLVVYSQKIEDLDRATTTSATDLLIIDQTATTSGISITNFFGKVPVTLNMLDQNITWTNAAEIDNTDADTLTLLETIVQVDGILNIIDLKTATTTVLTPTSTGNVDTLETEDISDITIDDLSVDEIVVNTSLTVDGTYNYAADAQGDDDYEVAIPGITALVAGLQVTFLANTANTDGATLEITSVGDLDAILKQHDVVLATNDIEAGSVVVCVFDGTNWQMVSPVAN